MKDKKDEFSPLLVQTDDRIKKKELIKEKLTDNKAAPGQLQKKSCPPCKYSVMLYS